MIPNLDLHIPRFFSSSLTTVSSPAVHIVNNTSSNKMTKLPPQIVLAQLLEVALGAPVLAIRADIVDSLIRDDGSACPLGTAELAVFRTVVDEVLKTN